MISVIVPMLNEGDLMPALATRLHELVAQELEVIVVDGGSDDGCADYLVAQGLQVIVSPRAGRASQMNVGAAAAKGDTLLFLHADTYLPPGAVEHIAEALATGKHWGRFDVTIEGRSRWLPVIAFLMNWRSRLTGIATGDQALFIRAQTFSLVGGFPEQPLMEDVELSYRLLRQCGRPACLGEHVVTSGRRWESNGVCRTILLMWRLRLAYWRGVPAAALAQMYRAK